MSRLQAAATDDGLTARQLREAAVQLRLHAGRHAQTEAEMTAFLDRADEIRTEAWIPERRKKRR